MDTENSEDEQIFGSIKLVKEKVQVMQLHIIIPAIFPEELADHIVSWSNEYDLIYDPFMGSGTTAKMALLCNRNFIGSEISKEYCEIANERINQYVS